jgi:CPA2 family monovalent cation:H+ antiporter-2
VGIERARVIVFAIASVAEERRGVAVARHLNPRVRIVVRTRYVAALDELRAAGADEVIPEEFETSIEIFARVLRLYGVAGNVVEREVTAVRGEAYEALRGLSMPDLRPEALEHYGVQAALDTVEIEPGARAVGENPVSLSLRRETGASVIAAVRGEEVYHAPNPEFRFEAGDVVVLVGDREARENAAALFRSPTD